MTAQTVLNIHPKLFASIATGVGLAVVTAATTHVDPSLFTGLGVWAAPTAMLVTVLLSGLAGWLKTVRATEPAEDQAATDAAEAQAEPVAQSAFDALIADKQAPAETQSEVINAVKITPAVQSTIVG